MAGGGGEGPKHSFGNFTILDVNLRNLNFQGNLNFLESRMHIHLFK